MKKFDFRLERVLEYRRMVEEWAKQTYLDARAARLEMDAELLSLQRQRDDLTAFPVDTVEDAQTLDLRMAWLDEQESHRRAALAVLEHEEEHAMTVWSVKRQEAEAIEKLKEKAREEWLAEADREEQKQLDEWSVQRRKAS